MSGGTIYVYFGKHRKGYTKFGGAEILYLFFVVRFLTSKLIAGKTENNEALRMIGLVKLF